MTDPAGGPSLSEAEMKHVRLIEEYRHALRQELEQSGKKKSVFSLTTLSDKLVFPAVVVLVSAIASGYAIPWILSQQDKERRMAAIRAETIESISEKTATIAAAYQSFEGELENYWTGSLDLNGRYLQLKLKSANGEIGDEEFKREDGFLEADRTRLNEQLLKAHVQLDSEQRAFLIWGAALASRLRLYYGPSPERDNQFARLTAATLAASATLDKKDAAFTAILDARGKQYRAVLAEAKSSKLPYEDARAKVVELLEQHPAQLAGEGLSIDWSKFSATVEALQKEVLHGEVTSFN